MSEVPDVQQLDSCGCCEAEAPQPVLYNPPGQRSLNYRLGQHPDFLRRMAARLTKQRLPDGDQAGQRPLADLKTRAADDPSIALLDAWATVAHVLAFYQERIANEGYLRTATERRSLLELARAIGYELSPGVAAEAFLAFTVDEAEQTPDETTVAAGTQVQSIPSKEGELPQTFETSTDFVAKVWWNKLRPQLQQPQQFSYDSAQVYLLGTTLNLAAGDRLLLVGTDAAGKLGAVRRRVRTVKTSTEHNHTLVTFEGEPGQPAAPSATPAAATPPAHVAAAQAQNIGFKAPFNAANVDSLLGLTLAESQFQALVKMSGWKTTDVIKHVGKKPQPASLSNLRVFVLREKAAIFGHNAPHYLSLPVENRGTGTAYPHPWDGTNVAWPVWHDSLTNAHYKDVDLYLERPIAGIHEDSVQAQSWLLLELPTGDTGVYRVTGVAEASLNGFGISAKTTALKLVNEDGSPPTKSTDFTVRKTTAYLKSEELLLAALPLSGEIASGATQLTLNGLAPELQVGQPVALTGEQADADGVTRSEIAILAAISHNEGFTTLKFTEGLTYSYKRATLTISANVVRATHGETVAQEVLGGGDGAQPNQRFKLKKPPLTHVSAATASGAENRLTVRVNRVEWEQAPSLYGLDGNDRKYVVRIDHDGSAIVIFGDGKQGARLPTGQENVVATYRSGIGAAGEVDAGSLTLLKKRPFGVRGVTNPVAAAGAEDPETRDEARQNAPLTVLTLDRVVSLQDFEDFARAYAGIGKAQAVALWSGETELVHITVAGANGDEIAATSDLLKNLRNAIAGARDPLRAVEIGTFQLRYFDVAAYIQIAPAYLWEDVKGQIESGLINAFSFAARGFGQPATAAEVVNVIHNTPGVVAVDLERFYLIDELGQPVGALLSSVLPTQPVRLNPDRTASGAQRFLPAELVLINPAGITLTEMTP